MKRRAFFGAIGAAVAAAKIATPAAPALPGVKHYDGIRHADNGNSFLIGVATADVRKGGIVEVQVAGEAHVRVARR